MMIIEAFFLAKKSIILLTMSFSPGTPNSVYLQPIHSDLYNHNLLFLQPCLRFSRISPFLHHPFPMWPHSTTTHNSIFENLNLTHRVLELTHPKSATALCHTSFINDYYFPIHFRLLNTCNDSIDPTP